MRWCSGRTHSAHATVAHQHSRWCPLLQWGEHNNTTKRPPQRSSPPSQYRQTDKPKKLGRLMANELRPLHWSVKATRTEGRRFFFLLLMFEIEGPANCFVRLGPRRPILPPGKGVLWSFVSSLLTTYLLPLLLISTYIYIWMYMRPLYTYRIHLILHFGCSSSCRPYDCLDNDLAKRRFLLFCLADRCEFRS